MEIPQFSNIVEYSCKTSKKGIFAVVILECWSKDCMCAIINRAQNWNANDWYKLPDVG